MHKLIIIVILLSNSLSYSQHLSCEWANSGGGETDDYSNSLCTDNNGNVYVVGSFSSPSISFGNITLNNSGAEESFIVKYDINGDVSWARSFACSSIDGATSVSTDLIGNIYVSGFFTSTFTFGTDILTPSNNNYTPYILKYDTYGNEVWGRQGICNNISKATSVITDNENNIYLTGHFASDSIIFNNYTLYNNTSNYSMFLVKYNSMGDVQWAKDIEEFQYSIHYHLANDNQNNIYVSGIFSENTLSIGSYNLTKIGTVDAFIAKYDKNGAVLMAKNYGGSKETRISSIMVNNNNELICAGHFSSPSITFDTITLVNSSLNGLYNVPFILKLDTNYNVKMAKTINVNNLSSNNYYFSKGLSSDTLNNIFVIGETPYLDSLHFGNSTLQSVYGFYILKYDSIGNELWCEIFNNINIPSYSDRYIEVDNNGDLFITSVFSNTFAIIDSDTLSNVGYASTSDIIILKLNENLNNDIVEIKKSNEILIYPNPTRDNLNIVLDVEFEKIEIYNIYGVKILSTFNSLIDLSNHINGLYFITIIDKNGSPIITKMIIKQE